ncbi:MAG: glycosyltransferase family 2 protein [Gemmataceae bacterium]|nr:glycosyltransferase family 2 protein [Gemmataceae bacterium]
MSPTPLELACWACLGVVAFAYAGYPVLIYALSKLFGRPPVPPPADDARLPAVSLLIAAYNEEVDIEARVLNLLRLDYPRDKLELVIASDGSTDRTNDIVRRYEAAGVKLVAYGENKGKATVLNRTVPTLSGEVVALSDANTHWAPDALRNLARWFADPSVGVVNGKLVLVDPATGRNVDGLYWKYETFLKKCESKLGALLGTNGAIYAVRKDIFPAVTPGTLIDDFVIPMNARRATGCRIVYDTKAVASEETAPTIRAEFRRRVRIGAGGYQSIALLWPLLSPAHGWVALTFFCHKIVRWVCPFFLLAALVLNVLLFLDPAADQLRAAWLLAAQAGFYALAAAGNWVPARPRWLRFFRLPTLFASMNLALFFGFFRWLFGPKTGTWKRTDRGQGSVIRGQESGVGGQGGSPGGAAVSLSDS